MSSKTWTEHGFGVKLFTDNNEKQVFAFIANNLDLLEYINEVPKIRTALENCADYDEYSNIMINTLYEYPCDAVAGIINRKEGTTIFRGYRPDGDTDQEEMIGAEPMYPWDMNDRDRSISYEETKSILKKYAAEIGQNEDPYDFDAEYYG